MNAPDVERVQPTESDIAKPYWEGCRQGELRLQHCSDCDQFQFYPRILCSHCGGRAITWSAVSGKGRVGSFTIVRRGISKAYAAPYVVALVNLAEGPVMMTHVISENPEDVAVGQDVTVRFEAWGGEHVLPVFEIAK